jgi:hypothetical protein
MNQPKKPSMLWSIFWSAVGIGLPAFVTLSFFGLWFVGTDRSAPGYIAIGIVFAVSTLWLVYGVYRGFAASNARWLGVLVPLLTIGLVGSLVGAWMLSYDALTLELNNSGSVPVNASLGGDEVVVHAGQTWSMRYSVGDKLRFVYLPESPAQKGKVKTAKLDREGPPVGDRPGPLKAEVNADGEEISFRFRD